MSIGNALNELIKLNDTNVNELARNIHVSPQTIYSIIKRNNKKIDMDILMKLSKALGVTPDYFYGENFGGSENHITVSLEEKEMIFAYRNLNQLGKSEVKKRIEELSFFEKYTLTKQLPLTAYQGEGYEEKEITKERYDKATEELHKILKQMP